MFLKSFCCKNETTSQKQVKGLFFKKYNSQGQKGWVGVVILATKLEEMEKANGCTVTTTILAQPPFSALFSPWQGAGGGAAGALKAHLDELPRRAGGKDLVRGILNQPCPTLWPSGH